MTTVYKCKFHYALTTPPINYNVYKIAMLQKICEVFDSLPGVTNIIPFTTPGIDGSCYATFDLSGSGKSQFVISSYYGSSYWGVCSDDHNWNSVLSPNVSYYFMENNVEVSGDYDFDAYFIVRNNKLIAAVHPWSGFWIFHVTTDNDLIVAVEGVTSVYSLSAYYSSTRKDDVLIKPSVLSGNGASYQAHIGYSTWGISSAAGTYNVPTGKVLKYSNIYVDKTGCILKQIDDFPVAMHGAGVPLAFQQDPTFRKISIDGQKYIHIGSLNWIQYDTIVENTYNVGGS